MGNCHFTLLKLHVFSLQSLKFHSSHFGPESLSRISHSCKIRSCQFFELKFLFLDGIFNFERKWDAIQTEYYNKTNKTLRIEVKKQANSGVRRSITRPIFFSRQYNLTYLTKRNDFYYWLLIILKVVNFDTLNLRQGLLIFCFKDKYKLSNFCEND